MRAETIKVILVIVFSSFAAVLPAQLQFNILEHTLESVTVDGAIDVKIQLKNNSKRKVHYVTYPLVDALSAYIKLEEDSTWREISIMTLSDPPWQLKLRPGQQVDSEISLKHDFPLEPDKNYYLMLFYVPSVNSKNGFNDNLLAYYFQNHPGISRHNNHLSDHLIIKTEKLTGNDLKAWNELKKDSTIEFYMKNSVGDIAPAQFEKMEQFLIHYPDSRFSGKIKSVFIHYLTRREVKMSNLQFEKAMEYIKELNGKQRVIIPDWEIDLIRNKKQEN